jgi:hypothetical protein
MPFAPQKVAREPSANRKVSIVDRCVERLLRAMIARDESWIDGSHRLGACVVSSLVNGQT